MKPSAAHAPSRRRFLKFAAAGGATLALPAYSPREALPAGAEPHFFLLVILNGGADTSYMFDARPLSMTRAGMIQNFLGQEPMPWRGLNGVSTLATSLVKPLIPFRDQFSIVNGVVMTPSFDGHQQNMNFLFAGNPFGGESFVPHLNRPETVLGRGSLDAIALASQVPIVVDNHSAVVSLQPGSMGTLAAKLKELGPVAAGDPLHDFVRARIAANAAGPGRLASGAREMLGGIDGAEGVRRKLALLTPPNEDETDEMQALSLISECFKHSIARSAIYVLPEYFDVHAGELAKAQPKLFTSAIGKIAALIDGLDEMQYDAHHSMLDVTTVMVASEFGRTMRTASMPIYETGTNHNSLSNTILLGGKGIRGGLVIGASDLANEKAKPSGAHLAMDRTLEKAMGLPFDFGNLRPIAELPDEFELEDHLTIASVINTVYSLFGVEKSNYRALGRNLPIAPVLQGLLT